MKDKLRIWWPVFSLLIVIIVLLAVLVISGESNTDAVTACVNQGGQTWDDGAHCVLGNPTVINTQ